MVKFLRKYFHGNLVVKVYCDVSKLSAWGDATGTITIKSNGGTASIECRARRIGNLIELQINSNTAIINSESVPVDPAPVIKNGSTVVPLRFIGEALGAEIEWDAADKKVTYKLEGRKLSFGLACLKQW
ncbi:MAG: copper amine oxidase N-terminal domain-containing protein [Caldisericia bacterium]